MHIKPFRIEHYFARHEFSAKFLLASSDAETRTIREVLELEPGGEERLLGQACGYTESQGAPWLRATICGIYEGLAAEQVLVPSSAEEGIFLVYHALVGSGDQVIIETPCFESALELARSTRAEVCEWRRRPECDWAHDLAALEELIRPNTRMLYIATPHNPTGLLMPRLVFEGVIDLCQKHGILLFCDEVFRELEHDSATRLPAACDLYENAISLGSMSKSYGLPGLRLGWIASRNRSVIERCLDLRFYTTICNSAPSEILTDIALRHREVLVRRNLEIVRRNLSLLDRFIEQHPEWFSWVRPDASPMGFVRFAPERDVTEFCDEVVRRSGVMLLPGTVYDEPRHIRFGYGRLNMPQALEQLSAHLASLP